MKPLVQVLAIALCCSSAFTAEISESESGAYMSKLRDGTPVYFILSKVDGKWSFRDKESGGLLSKFHCLSDCEYRNTLESDNQQLIPAEQRQFVDMACIKNISFAFCRLSSKQLPACGPDFRGPVGSACRMGPESKPSNTNYLMFVV